MTKEYAYRWLTQPGVKACLGFGKDETTAKAIMVAVENLKPEKTYSEFALEVYGKDTDKFIHQVDVFATLDEAWAHAKLNPLKEDDEIYEIIMITYDSNGNEISSCHLDV